MKWYLFDSFILDKQQHCLYKDGKQLKIGTIAYKILLYFVTNPNQTIHKEDLINHVWQNTIVTEATLYKQIQRLRDILKDDSESQTIIKTVHGVGFEFLPEVTCEQENPLKPKSISKEIKPWYIFIFIILILTTSYFLLKKTDTNITQTQGLTLRQAIFNMKNAMSINKKAFFSQIRIRNELGKLLDKRFGPQKNLSWERKFFKFYDKMNEEEHFLFNQIRAYTEGPMYQNNQILLDLINNHPKILQEIPLADELRTHLTIWINKYNKVFKQNSKMALLYVGVEDGAPYPSEVDQQVDSWLTVHYNVKN